MKLLEDQIRIRIAEAAKPAGLDQAALGSTG